MYTSYHTLDTWEMTLTITRSRQDTTDNSRIPPKTDAPPFLQLIPKNTHKYDNSEKVSVKM